MRIQFLKDLHDIVQKAYAGELEEEAAPDDDAGSADPMNDVDAPDVQTPIETCGRGVKRPRKRKTGGKVLNIDFPLSALRRARVARRSVVLGST